MSNSADFRIAAFPGDGIGHEMTAPGDLVTCELGGDAGTAAVFAAIETAMDGLDA